MFSSVVTGSSRGSCILHTEDALHVSAAPGSFKNLRITQVVRAIAIGPREMGGSHRYLGPYMGYVQGPCTHTLCTSLHVLHLPLMHYACVTPSFVHFPNY